MSTYTRVMGFCRWQPGKPANTKIARMSDKRERFAIEINRRACAPTKRDSWI